MKYYKRLNVYKASNVSFEPDSIAAYSYDWWQFVRVVNGSVVFNDYSYSPSTRKHQYKVRSLLNQLNINIDLVINTRAGLQACNGVHSFQDLATEAMREAIYNDDLERAQKIAKVFKQKLSSKFIQSVYDQKEEDLCNEYLRRALKYQEKKELESRKLKSFLDDLNILKIERGSKTLIVAKSENVVSFHLAGQPENAVKHDAEYCSPNTIADICMNQLSFPLLSEEVVRISNFC